MPDVFALSAVPSLARLRVAEVAVATADDDGDARVSSIRRLAVFDRSLGVERRVIDALDIRIKERRPVPAKETTQNLVRRARRRLEQERLGAWRGSNELRTVTVTRLRAVLEE
jgi:hypothetical protein